MWPLRVALTGLFLRGVPRGVAVPKKRRPLIESVIRRHNPRVSEVAECLAAEGMWLEATTLQSPGLLSLSESLLEADQVLTAACESYPLRWLDVLDASAPPALWRRGEMPVGPTFAMVGSRQIDRPANTFAKRAAAAVVESGSVVVSGAAAGADRAAASAAETSLIEIVPHGLDYQSPRPGVVLSVAAPNEEFTTGLAMERNALIYACAEHSLVVAVRLKEGGTWVGATTALRQHLSSIWVRDVDDAGVDALVGLGARRLADPTQFPKVEAPAATLFG